MRREDDRPSTTTDLMAEFVQPAVHGVGQSRTPETIEREIAKIDLWTCLDALAQLHFRFDRANATNALKVAEELDPTLAVQYAKAMQRSGQGPLMLVAPQALQRLSVFALAHGTKSEPRDMKRVARKLLSLAVSLQDSLGPTDIEARDLSLEITRVTAYYQEPPSVESADVTIRMLEQHDAYPQSSPDWIDLDRLAQPTTCQSLRRLLAISVLAGLTSTRTQGNHRWPPDIGGDFSLSFHDLVEWANLFATSLDDIQRRALEDLKGESWAISSVVSRPLIRFDENRFIWLRPTDVKRLSTPPGLRSLLERRSRELGADSSRIGPYWGRLFEKVGQELAQEAVTSERTYLAEETLRHEFGASNLVCDGVFLEKYSALAFDFTVGGLTVAALTDADSDAFWDTHSQLLSRKIEQLDSILSNLDSTARIELGAAIIIVGGLLPWTPFVDEFVTRLTQVQERKFLGSSRALPIRVISMVDFRWLLSASEHFGKEAAEVIEDWIRSGFGGSSLRAYLTSIETPTPSTTKATELIRSVAGRSGREPMQTSSWNQ